MAIAPTTQQEFQRASEEAQPRCGVTLDGVQRPLGHPRAESEAGTRRRQVRWNQPTDISRINRRIYWLRLFRCTTLNRKKKKCPKLGSQPLTAEVISTLELSGAHTAQLLGRPLERWVGQALCRLLCSGTLFGRDLDFDP